MTTHKNLATAGSLLLALTLAACGGGGSDAPATAGGGGSTSSSSSSSGGATTNAFTQEATWAFQLPATGQSVCYDFNARQEVAGCTGTGWDLKVTSGGRSASLFTNSGTSGAGNGAALGSPFAYTWAQLQTWLNATIDPVNGAVPAQAWIKDSASSVFSSNNTIGSSVFEYGLASSTDHLLYPTYRRFLITTDNTKATAVTSAPTTVYALQVIGYYGGPGGTASGYPKFRWVDTAPSSTVREATVNASGSAWVYFDLVSGTESSESGVWQIAFNRYNMKLNSGISGSGTAGGFLSATPTGFYDADGKAVASAITSATPASTLATLSTGSNPASASAWKKDSAGSLLSPTQTGTYPNPLNYGWYTYYPTDAAAAPVGLTQHMLKANPDSGTIIRGGEGNTYAKVRVNSISYAPATPAYNGAQTWTVNFQVQP
ncbi:HmuY family protein [Uliginosibacterium sp. H1]|uniref:HmuY family protein n=1 Tax=Uliginosibacterium sp. H1 TaxID=3114757 RepID=UPI002E16C335|nr:HmuY family protein [Uliginosibacterium sp. H1]